MERFQPNISEKHGIDLIKEEDVNILSIGINTEVSAEIEMAKKILKVTLLQQLLRKKYWIMAKVL